MAVQPITHPLVHFRLPLRVPVPRAPACRPMVRQPRIHEHAHRLEVEAVHDLVLPIHLGCHCGQTQLPRGRQSSADRLTMR